MKIKFVDIIVTFIGVIYLFFIAHMLTNFEFFQLSAHFLRGCLFCITLFLIFKYNNNKILFIYFPMGLFYFLYGLIKGNWINFIIYDVLSAAIFIFIFLLRFKDRDIVTQKIIDLLSILSFIGTASALYYLYSNGLEVASTIANRMDGFAYTDEDFSIKKAFAIMQVSLILFPFLWFVDFKRKLILFAGLIAYLACSFMLLTRAGIAGSLFIILMTLFIGAKDKHIKLDARFVSFIFILIFSFGAFFNKYNDVIESVVTLSTDRFIQGFEGIEFSGDGNSKEEPRVKEAREYYASLEYYEIIIGQGMGGVNRYPFGKFTPRGLPMMHLGENMLIMKGGVILLLTVYGLAVYAILRLFLSKTKYGYSYMAFILFYLLMERGHQQFSQFFMLLFFCLAVSYSFSIKSFKMFQR